MNKIFDVIPHTADLKIRVYGNSLEELFRHALIGMFQSIDPKPKHPESCKQENDFLVCEQLPIKRDIQVSSFEIDSLLVDFLSDALYLSDINDEAYLDVDITVLSQTHLEGTLKGIKIDGFDLEIKAVTYHDLSIKQEAGAWQTDIVFDI